MPAANDDAGDAPLKRSLGLGLITLYGLGTTIGAGIYVLIGEVAAAAGVHAPLSFLLAALIVSASALSFGELASRMPRSAGEALYTWVAFRSRVLATAVGLLVAAAGIVSAATIARGLLGYLGYWWTAPPELVLLITVAALGLVAAWGITESALVAALATLVELAGLGLVIWFGRAALVAGEASWTEIFVPAGPEPVAGIVAGAVLAFYAFIGFEDMVNVAEEVRDVRRRLPQAIVLTLCVTAALYVTLAVVAVRLLPAAELAASDAPLALMFERSSGLDPGVLVAIAAVAVLNGALIQIIMASRVLYGLSRQGWLPGLFGAVHGATRTPAKGTVLVTAAVLCLALAVPLVTLAEITSVLTLVVFATVNGALLALKRRAPHPPEAFRVPALLPLLGLLASVVFAGIGLAGLVGG